MYDGVDVVLVISGSVVLVVLNLVLLRHHVAVEDQSMYINHNIIRTKIWGVLFHCGLKRTQILQVVLQVSRLGDSCGSQYHIDLPSHGCMVDSSM